MYCKTSIFVDEGLFNPGRKSIWVANTPQTYNVKAFTGSKEYDYLKKKGLCIPSLQF